VAWQVTRDVGAFLKRGAAFLGADPVLHTPLLTESAYLAAHPSVAEDLLLGWWSDEEGVVRGAFVRAPRHAPLLSLMPTQALVELVEVLPAPASLGVPGGMDVDVARTWDAAGHALVRSHEITVHRLASLRDGDLPAGAPRVAGDADRDLLHDWFDRLMAAHPDDPSERTYVVDDPLGFGGIVLWEVDGTPVAMCGSSRTVAGMVRLGPTFAPGAEQKYADAAFAAACARARRTAEHVLVLAPTADQEASATLSGWGFVPDATRVVLAASAEGQ